MFIIFFSVNVFDNFKGAVFWLWSFSCSVFNEINKKSALKVSLVLLFVRQHCQLSECHHKSHDIWGAAVCVCVFWFGASFTLN